MPENEASASDSAVGVSLAVILCTFGLVISAFPMPRRSEKVVRWTIAGATGYFSGVLGPLFRERGPYKYFLITMFVLLIAGLLALTYITFHVEYD